MPVKSVLYVLPSCYERMRLVMFSERVLRRERACRKGLVGRTGIDLVFLGSRLASLSL